MKIIRLKNIFTLSIKINRFFKKAEIIFLRFFELKITNINIVFKTYLQRRKYCLYIMNRFYRFFKLSKTIIQYINILTVFKIIFSIY